MSPVFQDKEITTGMLIRVKTTLAHHKEVVVLRVDEIHTALNIHPLCNDPSGTGTIQGSRDHVAFYQSQIVGIVK